MRLCPSCGRTNRIPDDRLAAEARCGACKAALPPPADPIEADPAVFDAAISQPTLPVLVEGSLFINNIATVAAGALATTNVVGTIVGAPNNFVTTVSGCTTTKAVRQSRQALESRIQNSRSPARSGGRLTVRLNTANC